MKILHVILLISLLLASGLRSEASLSFNGSSDKLVSTSLPVSGTSTATFCAWVYTGVTGATQDIITINRGNSASFGDGFQLRLHTTNGVRARQCDTTICSAPTTSGTVATNTWTPVCAVFTSTTSRTAYVNGTASTTDTTSVNSPSNLTETDIGASVFNSTYSGFFNGRIADAAIWNVALTQAEITSLSKGFVAPMIRPNALVMWVPMIGASLMDRRGGISFTATGTSAADHPPLFMTF